MLVLGVASGLGAGIGAVLAYKVADAVVVRAHAEPDGRVFRWIARNTDTRPQAHVVRDLPRGAVTAPRRHDRDAARDDPLRDATAGPAAVPRQVLPQRAARRDLLGVRLVGAEPRVGRGEHRRSHSRSPSSSCSSSPTTPRRPGPPHATSPRRQPTPLPETGPSRRPSPGETPAQPGVAARCRRTGPEAVGAGTAGVVAPSIWAMVRTAPAPPPDSGPIDSGPTDSGPTASGSRSWHAGPRCRSTPSASTRSAGSSRRPSREGRIAWYTAEHVERLARIRELQRDGFSLA